MSNAEFSQGRRSELVKKLMSARPDVRKFKDDRLRLAEDRGRVDAVKIGLGERDPSGGRMERLILTGIRQ